MEDSPIKKTILLVEDQALIAMAERKVIEGFGYSVLTAGTGEKALEIAFGPDTIDLILMDIELGKGMDGTEAARRILEKKYIPIVFLTSHSESEMVERVRGITRYGYVIKNSGNFVLKTSIEMALELFGAYEMKRTGEAQLKALVRTIPELVWLKDKDGVFLACNPGFEEYFGATEKEICGKTDYDFVDKELADFFRENDREAIEQGGPRSNEEWVTYETDGRRVLLETIKTPMYRDDGKLIGVLGIARDITKHKQLEQALKESEEKYRSLVENSLAGVYILQGGFMRYANTRFCEIFGYTHEELVNRLSHLELIAPEDRDLVTGNIQKRIEGKLQSLEYEFTGMKKDGSKIALHVLSSTVSFHGKPAILGTILDVTEKKRAESILKERVSALSMPKDDTENISFSELFDLEEIQKLQDQFSDALGIASLIEAPNGDPITKPSNFCRLCNDIIRKTERGSENCRKSDVAIGRYNPDGPVFRPCLSGGLMDAGANITVRGKHLANWFIGQIRTNDMDMEKMLEYADKIGADRKEFSKALAEVPIMSKIQFQKASHFLFTMANELSFIAYQNLQQGRFINEKKTAEEALVRSNREKALFLKDMQHRMKNTLGIIASLLSLEQGRLDPNTAENKKIIQVFQNSITRIHSISRIYDQLYQKGRLNSVDLKEYIHDSVDWFSASYTIEQDTIRFSSNLEHLEMDIKRATNIGLILNELLINAIKYAFPDNENGIISIHLERNDDIIILTVSDNGIGLNEDFNKKSKGTGLQIIDLLATEMDGSFFITGNHGTTATVKIKSV